MNFRFWIWLIIFRIVFKWFNCFIVISIIMIIFVFVIIIIFIIFMIVIKLRKIIFILLIIIICFNLIFLLKLSFSVVLIILNIFSIISLIFFWFESLFRFSHLLIIKDLRIVVSHFIIILNTINVDKAEIFCCDFVICWKSWLLKNWIDFDWLYLN